MRVLSAAVLTGFFLTAAQAQEGFDASKLRPSLSQQRMINPPAHRPQASVFVDGMNPDAVRKPMPQGRGMQPLPRGTGGPGDVARSQASPYQVAPPTGYETPYYGVPYGAPREQIYDLSPGAGPRQGYYESSQGYYETPDFSAPEPRYSE